MAVNAFEKAQVGHYYLLKRDYVQAWRWYERVAETAMLPAPKTLDEWINRFRNPRDISVFQYFALMRQGRLEEARSKLAWFRRNYPPRLSEELMKSSEPANPQDSLVRQLTALQNELKPEGLVSRLLQDLYIAQVLLSLDAAEDAHALFRTVLNNDPAESNSARLSAAATLSQILLLEQKHSEYAELATDTLAPLLLKARGKHMAPKPTEERDLARVVPTFVGALTMMPLMSRDFLAGLPRGQVERISHIVETLRTQAQDDEARLAIDLVLEASYRSLEQELQRQQSAERIKANPLGLGAVVDQGLSKDWIDSARTFLSWQAPGD